MTFDDLPVHWSTNLIYQRIAIESVELENEIRGLQSWI